MSVTFSNLTMDESKYVTINGVRRFECTCASPSMYDFFHAYENITVSRYTLEREVRRIIEDAMVNGGQIAELSMSCMTALDADSLAEQRARSAEFLFETTIAHEKWGAENHQLAYLAKKSLSPEEWSATQQLAAELAKTSLTLQDTYDDLRGSEEKTTAVAEKIELMESLMRGCS